MPLLDNNGHRIQNVQDPKFNLDVVNLQTLKRFLANISGGTVTGITTGNYLPITGGTMTGPFNTSSTILSGGTNLYSIFAPIGSGGGGTGVIQSVIPGTNITSGGTFANPIINLASNIHVNNLTTSGSTSVQNFSATTIFSGNTDLYNIFITQNDGNDITRVQPGSNISTGGTGNNPIISLNSNIGINSFTASGNSIVSANLSATTFYSGNTPLSTIIQNIASQYATGSTGQTLTGSFLNLSGGTVTGTTNFISGLSANTLSGGTIYSGNTDLYNIFQQIGQNASQTYVQPGSNISTGGTSINPVISLVSSPSVNNLTVSGTSLNNNLSATTLSGGTILSGSTDLYNIFLTTADGNDITRVQPGLNTYTGGTGNNPTVNISAATLNSLTVSGNSIFNTLSATSLSANTFYSGSTDLSNLFATSTSVNLINTQLQTKANLSGSTFTGGVIAPSLSATTLSGGTLYSGSTPLSTIIQNIASQYSATTDFDNYLSISGGTVTGTTNFISGLSANTLSGGTILSGSTDLYNIFLTTADGNDITRVQTGLNTYTGGTGNNPTVNISAATLNSLTVSGSSIFNTLSATTLSGGTILSGSTDLSSLFATSTSVNLINSQLPTKANLSGATFTGNINIPSLSATSLSANTFYSGSTPLYTIIQNISSQYSAATDFDNFLSISGGTVTGTTNFISGLSANTLSGGTILSGSTDLNNLFATQTSVNLINSQLPTKANLSGATFTGNINTPSLSATTLSGGAILSGSTDLYNIFITQNDGNDITRVQPGLNTYTGGTGNNPTVNISAATLNNVTVSGNSIFNTLSATTLSGGTILSGSTDLNIYFNQDRAQINTKSNLSGATFTGNINTPSLSATTLSGGTIYSGSTNLYGIFQQLNTSVQSVQPGSNITTGGTTLSPVVNLVNSPSVNNLTVSGVSNNNIVSATTLSAGTIISGSTNLYQLFSTVSNQNIIRNLSTGLISGGTITINSDNTKFDVSPAYGVVIDYWTDISNPTITYVNFPGQSGITTTYLSSSTLTHISLTNSGSIFQTTTEETNTFRRNNIMLGVLNHLTNTGITSTINQVDSIFSPLGQYRDLMATFNLINKGNSISANGANLQINKSAGYLYGQGLNFVSSIQDPNKKIFSAYTPCTFKIVTQSGYTSGNVSSIDPIKYDINGTPTTIGGSQKQAQNQRVYLLTDGNVNVQYGQTLYSNLASAIQGLQNETFISNQSNSDSGILIGIISIQANCTSLQDTTTSNIIPVSIFGEAIGGSAGLATTSLQQAYNNSLTPEITTNSILGALSIINGAGSDNNYNFEILNSASTITSYITGAGNLYANNISGNTLYSGSTNLYNIFQQIGQNVQQTNVQPGSNISTGGTALNPIINLVGSPFVNNLTVSGVSNNNILSATTLSANTIISGSTNLYNIFQQIGQGGSTTTLSNGINTYTGGTTSSPSVNVSALTINTLTASGLTSLQSVSATTLTATTITANTISATTYSGVISNTGVSVDGLGGVLSTGVTAYKTFSFPGHIIGWDLVASPTGNCVFDIWRINSGNTLPTVANSIVGGNYPTLTASAYSGSTNLTGWNINFNTGDIIAYNINSVTGITKATLTLKIST